MIRLREEMDRYYLVVRRFITMLENQYPEHEEEIAEIALIHEQFGAKLAMEPELPTDDLMAAHRVLSGRIKAFAEAHRDEA